VGITLVRNPGYFMAGLPNIDRVELVVDEDNAHLGWEFPGTINRIDWVQKKDVYWGDRPERGRGGAPLKSLLPHADAIGRSVRDVLRAVPVNPRDLWIG
jgi:hypothetical protein